MSVIVARMEYLEALTDWDRAYCAVAGRRSVLSKVTQFLPMTKTQREDPDMYRLYTERAMWYGASARTLDAWVGVLTRKPMNVQVPNRYRPRLLNIDDRGTDIDAFARHVVRHVCTYGRIGLLVDVAASNGPADYRSMPYIASYSATAIKNWRERMTTHGVVLDQVILEEVVEEAHPSGFGMMRTPQHRILELDDDGYYRCRIMRTIGGEDREVSVIYPTRGGKPLDFIPFYIVGASAVSPQIEKAPLQDVVDANFSHFQTSADYEFSLYWSASPTAVVTGLNQGEDAEPTLPIGGGSLWNLPAGATASYLEFKGQGLGALKDALTEKRELLATLGASVLNTPKREVETAEALTIKSNGESASLVTIADTVSKALTLCLRTACYWDIIDGDATATLNRDLINVRLKPDDIKALMLLVQNQLLSLDDFYHNLQQGEILRPGISIEQARDDAATQAPTLIGYDAAVARRQNPVKESPDSNEAEPKRPTRTRRKTPTDPVSAA